jgi:predicted Fe-Mo cluster-binding NifX family protein
VSPVFDWCGNLLLVEIQSGREVGRSEVAAADTDPIRQAKQLVELRAGLVVCGGIGEILLGLIEAGNIRVIPGVSGGIDDVLAALSAGELSDPRFMMPGCSGHRGQHRLRGGFGSKGRKHGRRRLRSEGEDATTDPQHNVFSSG